MEVSEVRKFHLSATVENIKLLFKLSGGYIQCTTYELVLYFLFSLFCVTCYKNNILGILAKYTYFPLLLNPNDIFQLLRSSSCASSPFLQFQAKQIHICGGVSWHSSQNTIIFALLFRKPFLIILFHSASPVLLFVNACTSTHSRQPLSFRVFCISVLSMVILCAYFTPTHSLLSKVAICLYFVLNNIISSIYLESTTYVILPLPNLCLVYTFIAIYFGLV